MKRAFTRKTKILAVFRAEGERSFESWIRKMSKTILTHRNREGTMTRRNDSGSRIRANNRDEAAKNAAATA